MRKACALNCLLLSGPLGRHRLMCDKRPVECKTDPALCLDALVVWSPCINMGTFIEKLII